MTNNNIIYIFSISIKLKRPCMLITYIKNKSLYYSRTIYKHSPHIEQKNSGKLFINAYIIV